MIKGKYSKSIHIKNRRKLSLKMSVYLKRLTWFLVMFKNKEFIKEKFHILITHSIDNYYLVLYLYIEYPCIMSTSFTCVMMLLHQKTYIWFSQFDAHNEKSKAWFNNTYIHNYIPIGESVIWIQPILVVIYKIIKFSIFLVLQFEF